VAIQLENVTNQLVLAIEKADHSAQMVVLPSRDFADQPFDDQAFRVLENGFPIGGGYERVSDGDDICHILT
jgi:hypothetical protein